MRNWAGNLTFTARTVHEPKTVDELRRVVAAAPRIKALGSGHSFSDVADTDGDQVIVPASAPELDGDRVRVGAATRYAELNQWLGERGRALANLASLPHISVAGSVATGTHGSGAANQSLAAAVAAVELVTAEGDLLELRRGDPRFPGAVVALGALGVVTRLTLDTVPAFELRQYVFEGLEGHLAQTLAAGYSVSLFTTWRGPGIDQVWLKTTQENPPAPYGSRPASGPRHPVPGADPVNCTEQGGVPGPSPVRLPHFRPGFTPSSGEELQSEWLLPATELQASFDALKGIADAIAPVLQICEIRAVAADDLWLSPAYGRDSVAFHFTWIKDLARVLPVVAMIEERLPAGRPHWGKVFTRPGDYPELPRFLDLALHLDPHRKFWNAFLSRHVRE